MKLLGLTQHPFPFVQPLHNTRDINLFPYTDTQTLHRVRQCGGVHYHLNILEMGFHSKVKPPTRSVRESEKKLCVLFIGWLQEET